MTTPTWAPINKTITSITQAANGVVTTSQSHGFFTGAFVRIVLPGNFGMYQINGQVFQITVLSPTTFSLNSNTSTYDAFNASLTTSQAPQVVPVGEIALSLASVERNTLIPVGG